MRQPAGLAPPSAHDSRTEERPTTRRSSLHARVEARGKFLWAGGEKLFVKGVTYGPFAPGADPQGFDDHGRVSRDFAEMSLAGINTVRVYDAPPLWLLDLAAEHGLRVIAGLAWEQHVAFLEDRRLQRTIVHRASTAVAQRAGHPALLAWAIGNEIPSDVVRWHGRRRVERFLRRLARAVRDADPATLLTYASFPSTEYLELPFVDFLSFNVFLEQPDRLDAYAARLHNLAGERPLVLTELGLDAASHGEDSQAASLREQLRVAFDGGCAGAIVFSWTDEWHRGGADVEGWAFGVTRRDGTPKPALAAISEAFHEVPFPHDAEWPRISVVVCTHDGATTIADCLTGVTGLDYPDFEVIVIDDGSTDATASIVGRFAGVQLISTDNRGLSAARNTGLSLATGELVAYLDDDARPDPQWLRYLARSFVRSSHAGVGGPNIQPPVERLMAQAVAAGPGGPIHVLLTDTVAEHIPGCNMAFRRDALEEVGGFDPRFRVAGDDVDLCWRLQDRGWTLGFSPAAVVYHRARATLREYWRQQRGYGRAEALLERKWPERYNGGGHVTWAGRVYGNAAAGHRHRRWRVYYGPQGSAPFQHAQDRSPGLLSTLPLLPEWYLVLALLAVLGGIDATWAPPTLAVLPFVLALLCTALRAGVDAWHAVFSQPGNAGFGARRRWALTTIAHLVQPPARLTGRLGHGLAPWRGPASGRLARPFTRTRREWHEEWTDAAERRAAFERRLRASGAVVQAGGAYDRWDFEVRAGAMASARALLLVEEHGRGRQQVCGRVWPHASRGWSALLASCAVAAAGAAVAGAWFVGAVLVIAVLLLGGWTLRDAGAAVARILDALEPPTDARPAPAPGELHVLAAGEQP